MALLSLCIRTGLRLKEGIKGHDIDFENEIIHVLDPKKISMVKKAKLYLPTSDGNSSAITNCTVSSNLSGKKGGGIYCGDSSIITSCSIIKNSSHDDGAGIYCLGSLNITDCTITDNKSDKTGGGICGGDSSAISNCNNMSSYNGGGIYCGDLSVIINCIMNANSSYD